MHLEHLYALNAKGYVRQVIYLDEISNPGLTLYSFL